LIITEKHVTGKIVFEIKRESCNLGSYALGAILMAVNKLRVRVPEFEKITIDCSQNCLDKLPGLRVWHIYKGPEELTDKLKTPNFTILKKDKPGFFKILLKGLTFKEYLKSLEIDVDLYELFWYGLCGPNVEEFRTMQQLLELLDYLKILTESTFEEQAIMLRDINPLKADTVLEHLREKNIKIQLEKDLDVLWHTRSFQDLYTGMLLGNFLLHMGKSLEHGFVFTSDPPPKFVAMRCKKKVKLCA
jgi:hypothetical protein